MTLLDKRTSVADANRAEAQPSSEVELGAPSTIDGPGCERSLPIALRVIVS